MTDSLPELEHRAPANTRLIDNGSLRITNYSLFSDNRPEPGSDLDQTLDFRRKVSMTAARPPAASTTADGSGTTTRSMLPCWR